MPFAYGDVLYANLDPSVGHEQRKRRPLVVMSGDRFNRACNQTFVCPVTSADTGYPLHVDVGAVRLDDGSIMRGFASVEQVKSLDMEARDAVKAGTMPDAVMARLSDLLVACLLRDDRMVVPM